MKIIKTIRSPTRFDKNNNKDNDNDKKDKLREKKKNQKEIHLKKHRGKKTLASNKILRSSRSLISRSAAVTDKETFSGSLNSKSNHRQLRSSRRKEKNNDDCGLKNSIRRETTSNKNINNNNNNNEINENSDDCKFNLTTSNSIDNVSSVICLGEFVKIPELIFIADDQ